MIRTEFGRGEGPPNSHFTWFLIEKYDVNLIYACYLFVEEELMIRLMMLKNKSLLFGVDVGCPFLILIDVFDFKFCILSILNNWGSIGLIEQVWSEKENQ